MIVNDSYVMILSSEAQTTEIRAHSSLVSDLRFLTDYTTPLPLEILSFILRMWITNNNL